VSYDDITPLGDDADEELTHAHIIKRIDRLEERLEPILAGYEDVAALSRSGHIIGRIILWIGGVVAACAATYTILTGQL